jgi:hypothetical protein
MAEHEQIPPGLLDYSVPIAEAYFKMLLISAPLIGSLAFLYLLLWGWASFITGLMDFSSWLSLLLALLIGVPLHELIHGLAWMCLGKLPRERVRFGFQWRTLTPYTHLKVPITARIYRWGTFAPALILGFLPSGLALVTGNGWLITFGLFYLFAAGGDLLVLWLLREVEGSALVLDHPSNAGCYVLKEADAEGKRARDFPWPE